MKSLRRYWETHNGETSPLLSIYDYLRSRDSLPDMSDLKKLAREISLPEATVRGAISYYSDLPSDRGGSFYS